MTDAASCHKNYKSLNTIEVHFKVKLIILGYAFAVMLMTSCNRPGRPEYYLKNIFLQPLHGLVESDNASVYVRVINSTNEDLNLNWERKATVLTDAAWEGSGKAGFYLVSNKLLSGVVKLRISNGSKNLTVKPRASANIILLLSLDNLGSATLNKKTAPLTKKEIYDFLAGDGYRIKFLAGNAETYSVSKAFDFRLVQTNSPEVIQHYLN